jgi:hypothetical protein
MGFFKGLEEMAPRLEGRSLFKDEQPMVGELVDVYRNGTRLFDRQTYAALGGTGSVVWTDGRIVKAPLATDEWELSFGGSIP